MRYCIALALMMITVDAHAQEGPDPGKCPLVQASRAAFAAAKSEAATLAATIAHMERFEGRRAVTRSRREGITSYIKAIGWQTHVEQSLTDLARDWKMNLCD